MFLHGRCIVVLFVLFSPLNSQDSSTVVRIAGSTSEMLNSLLDTLLRRPISKWSSRSKDTTSVYQAQRSMSSDIPFMCDTENARSPSPPTSVHQLRPGDIDVVAAMGDSLTSGNGPMAHDFARLMLNNRGISWTGGGQGDWRRYLTIPNFLKVFNPNLTGFATGDSYSYSKKSGFNVAVTGAITPDLPHQARVLVKRMRGDPRVDMENHWKLISIMIGSNDICIFACFNPSQYSGSKHGSYIMQALDYLYQNVPRLYINLVLQPELSALRAMPDISAMCHLAHSFECPCMFGAHAEAKAALADKMVNDYREKEKEVVYSGRYDGRQDFTVELQPFTENAMSPDMEAREEMDMNLFAIDCFHLSQKGNAYAANALWNNMLEPDWNKSRSWRPEFERVLCPNKNSPFLFTRQNSKLYKDMGKQIVQNIL